MVTVEPQSHLFRLPRELRDMIYHAALSCTTIELDNRPLPPGLLLSCAQIHSETLTLYYENTTFIFTQPTTLVKFLTALPPEHLRQIAKIRYDPVGDPPHPYVTDQAIWTLAVYELKFLRAELARAQIKLDRSVLEVKVVWPDGTERWWFG